MVETLTEALTRYIQKAIDDGGRQNKGNTLGSAISYNVYYYLKTVKAGSSFKNVTGVRDFIYNLVLAHKNKESKSGSKVERAYGTLLVTSSDNSTGFLIEESKSVVFSSVLPVYIGETLNYRLYRGKYIVEKAFTGSMSSKQLKTYGSGANVLARIGDVVSLAEYIPNALDPSLVTLENVATAEVPASEHIWHRDAYTYAYFNGKVYRETSDIIAGASDPSIDCTAYMSDAAGGSAVSNGGINYTRYPGATKAMKVLFYGKYRLVLLGRFYYTENNSQAADSSEVGVFDLLIIDSETQVVTKLGPTHSSWYNVVCPTGMYVGYVDVQISKQTGKLLVLKSADTPTSTNISVSYYVNADPVTDPQIYDHATDATVYRVPFSLDEMTINSEGTNLIQDTNHYYHDGVISTVDGVSVVGGITSTMFTQQPSSYNIYINRHLVAFKQETTTPTTPEEVLVAYRLLSYGRWEFYGVTEDTVFFANHSTACGGVTTTEVADKAIAVAQNYLVSTRPSFIRGYIPDTNRLAVDNSMMYYEHGGANYSGRPSSETIYYTYSGNSNISLAYAAAEASHLQDDRFLALTDGVNIKFFWMSRIQVLYNWFDNDPVPDTEHFSQGYLQGCTFWKNDIETYEMNILDASSIGKSMRWNGGFVSFSDATLIEYTYGLNNLSAAQITDSDFICTVSRAERVDYLEASDWSTRDPSEVHYDTYSFYAVAMTGGLAGLLFQGDTPTTHDITETMYLTLASSLQDLALGWIV